ncbi:hypothetical protein Dimus_016717 [Dionaea muscipula]
MCGGGVEEVRIEASGGALGNKQRWARQRDPRDLAIEGFPDVISDHWSLGRHGWWCSLWVAGVRRWSRWLAVASSVSS